MINSLKLNNKHESNIDSFKNNPEKVDRLINDIFKILSINENNLKRVENQNIIKRSLCTITGSNKRLINANKKNLDEVQAMNIQLLVELEKRNMMTRDNLLNVYNKVNDVKYNQIELKKFIEEALNKIVDRFEKMEDVQSLHSLIMEVDHQSYENMKKEDVLKTIIGEITEGQWNNKQDINTLKNILEKKDIIEASELTLKEIAINRGLLKSNELEREEVKAKVIENKPDNNKGHVKETENTEDNKKKYKKDDNEYIFNTFRLREF